MGHLNIYTNALVLTAIRTWLDYALSGEIPDLAAWIALLEQNAESLDYINTGYPDVAADDAYAPPVLARLEVWPNPARGSVNLGYRLEKGCLVSLAIYDLRGRKSAQAVRGRTGSGGASAVL